MRHCLFLLHDKTQRGLSGSSSKECGVVIPPFFSYLNFTRSENECWWSINFQQQLSKRVTLCPALSVGKPSPEFHSVREWMLMKHKFPEAAVKKNGLVSLSAGKPSVQTHLRLVMFTVNIAWDKWLLDSHGKWRPDWMGTTVTCYVS